MSDKTECITIHVETQIPNANMNRALFATIQQLGSNPITDDLRKLQELTTKLALRGSQNSQELNQLVNEVSLFVCSEDNILAVSALSEAADTLEFIPDYRGGIWHVALTTASGGYDYNNHPPSLPDPHDLQALVGEEDYINYLIRDSANALTADPRSSDRVIALATAQAYTLTDFDLLHSMRIALDALYAELDFILNRKGSQSKKASENLKDAINQVPIISSSMGLVNSLMQVWLKRKVRIEAAVRLAANVSVLGTLYGTEAIGDIAKLANELLIDMQPVSGKSTEPPAAKKAPTIKKGKKATTTVKVKPASAKRSVPTDKAESKSPDGSQGPSSWD